MQFIWSPWLQTAISPQPVNNNMVLVLEFSFCRFLHILLFCFFHVWTLLWSCSFSTPGLRHQSIFCPCRGTLDLEILNFSFSLIDIQTNIKNNDIDKWQTKCYNHRLDLCAITKQGMWNNRCKDNRRLMVIMCTEFIIYDVHSFLYTQKYTDYPSTNQTVFVSWCRFKVLHT